MSESPKSPKQKNGDRRDSDVSSADVGGDQGIDINNVKLTNATDFPIELDIAAEYQNILAAGILRNSEHIHVYDYICEVIFEGDRTFKLTTALFWIVFCIKFQPNSPEILRELRAKVSKLYSKHFAKLRSPKEDIANDLIFLFAYCVQVAFYSVFPSYRKQMTMRFILDIYHIVLFELHGFYVSDSYIQSSIEKLMGSKFFFYEQKPNKPKKKTIVKDKKNEPLLRDLNFNPDSMLHVSGGIEFASELSSRLRDKRQWFVTQELMNSEKSKMSSPTKRAATKRSQSKPPEETTTKQKEPEAPEKKGAQYFPPIKFDCTQISPTVSRFLNNPTMSLPFQKKKLIKYSNNKHVVNMQHFDVSNTIENLMAKKSSKTEHHHKTQTQFQLYSLKNRSDDYALGYLPPTDRFRLKERFKDEIDLKYILDNVGTFSLQPPSQRNADENKKVESKPFLSHHRTASVSGNFFSGQTVPNELEVAKQQPPEITSKNGMDSERPHDTETYHTKRNSMRESAISQLYTEAGRDSYVDTRKRPDLAVDVGLLTSPRSEDPMQTYNTPLLTPHNPSLLKKLGKANRKIQMVQALRPSEPPTDRQETQSNKLEVQAPLKKFTLDIQDLSRKGKVNQLRDEEESHAEARKNDDKGFVYEDKRKQYVQSHTWLFTRTTDKNINDLVHKLLVNRNMISKNATKYVRQNRK